MLIYQLTSKVDTHSLSTQQDWYYTLKIEDAKKIVKHLKDSSKGSFEYIFWVKPIRQAVRKKETEITIKTGGFTTSKFFQVLCDVAGGFENTQEVDRLDKDFIDWLTANYDYSGQGIEDENYWLSKSPTDFNLYSETQLKQEYHGLGKFVEYRTKAW